MWFSLTETYWWSGCTSSSFVIYCLWLFTDVDYFSCAKCSYYSRLMFMWFSLSKTYWWSGCTSFSFVIDIFFVWKLFYNFNTTFDNLLMLTIFHVQNVLIILDWCLCDFLLLKHIDEVDALHLHLSLTYFLCGKYSTISKLLFIIDWCWLFFMWKCSYHSWLMFMWFSCTETYWWSGCT